MTTEQELLLLQRGLKIGRLMRQRAKHRKKAQQWVKNYSALFAVYEDLQLKYHEATQEILKMGTDQAQVAVKQVKQNETV